MRVIGGVATRAAACAVGLAAIVALPVSAGAKNSPAPSGLACLTGKWVSQGITIGPGISGAAKTRLHITIETYKGHQYGGADANYDPSTPIFFQGASGGYLKLNGSSFGRFEYVGHGRYHFDPTISSETVTLVADGRDIFTKDVQGGDGYANITCSAKKFTTVVKEPTPEGGTAKTKETWKRV